MNQDILEGKWKQLRGEAKKFWGRLTDDDLDLAEGKLDIMAGRLQERYGYSRAEAEAEIERFVNEFENRASEL